MRKKQQPLRGRQRINTDYREVQKNYTISLNKFASKEYAKFHNMNVFEYDVGKATEGDKEIGVSKYEYCISHDCNKIKRFEHLKEKGDL